MTHDHIPREEYVGFELIYSSVPIIGSEIGGNGMSADRSGEREVIHMPSYE